jgi:hypothetical protein
MAVHLSSVPELQQMQIAQMVQRSEQMLKALTQPIDMEPDYSGLMTWNFDRHNPRLGNTANVTKHVAVGSRRHGVSIR